jgi:hypothetical protein
MGQHSLVSFNIPEAEMAEIKGHIQALHTLLLPYLKVLSPEERRELPRMGDMTFGFVQQALNHCKQNPELAPQFLDVAEFEIDFQGYRKIHSLYQLLLQITNALSDTMTLSGSEAYSAALVFYNSVRSAMKSKVQKAEGIYRELRVAFPRGKRLKRDAGEELPVN